MVEHKVKRNCSHCGKELSEFEGNYLQGETVYSSQADMTYHTGKNVCNKCWLEFCKPIIKDKINSDEESLSQLIRFSPDKKHFMVRVDSKDWLFDTESHDSIMKLIISGVTFGNRDGYLCALSQGGHILGVHDFLKHEERVSLSKELCCNLKDIHVHHIDGEKRNNKLDKEKWNNKLSNLEVLYKDKHAKKHKFNTWEEYAKHCGLKSYYGDETNSEDDLSLLKQRLKKMELCLPPEEDSTQEECEELAGLIKEIENKRILYSEL